MDGSETVFHVRRRPTSALPVSQKPEVVSSVETVANIAVICIAVEYEVDGCEFNYYGSAIFPLPVGLKMAFGYRKYVLALYA